MSSDNNTLISDSTRQRLRSGEVWSDDGVRLLGLLEHGEKELRSRPDRAGALAMLHEVIEAYDSSGADDFYRDNVADACRSAFVTAAARYGWRPLAEGEL